MIKLTDWLATYGAFLSTLVFIWNIIRSRPKIRIQIVYGIKGVVASIQNPSSGPVHITSVSFIYPYRRTTLREYINHLIKFKRIPHTVGWCHASLNQHNVDHNCPMSIESGKSHLIEIPTNALEDLFKDANARAFKIVVQDALWRNTYSPKFTYHY